MEPFERAKRGIALELGLLVLCMLFAFACGPRFDLDRSGAAEQAPKELFSVCPVGAQAGNCENPRGVAADPATGHVYIAAITGRRISEFTPWGDFVKAFGWDVAPGAVNEQQEVRVRAAAGQFRLSFGASTTADLEHDATAEEVEVALNGLASISTGGGSVSVSGGPGGSSNGTSSPYVISFNGGPLAATDVAQITAANGTTPLSGGTPSTLLEATTRANGTPGGTGFEACTAESGCKAGVNGAGGGQLSNTLGVALDSAGDVYAVDQTNRRVQKFDSEGRFLRTWGWDVVSAGPGNTGTGFEICVAGDGDTCKAGTTGTGQGQFGAWQIGSFIAIDSSDTVYVGDNNRIQKFASTGAFLSEISLPGEGFIKSLAIDSAGNLYTASQNFPSLVRKLNPAGGQICAVSGETEAGAIVPTAPQALATDSEDSVYVVDGASNPRILKFDSDCGPLLIEWAGDGTFTASTAIGTNICPGSEAPGNVYVANSTPASSLVRAFGTPPAGCELPPKAPPQIKEQYAVSVETDSARLQAVINPKFWMDTNYFVEYGTADCSLDPCDERAPLGAEPLLGAGVVDEDVATASVFLSDLEPGTTYFYRFVSESGGGGPIQGLGGTELLDGEVGTFTTPPLPATPGTACSNQEFRTGPSAFLPNCRAFEMVSPVDKNGGDITSQEHIKTNYALPGTGSGHDQSKDDGDGLTYSATQAFADAIGSPYTTQYLAHRNPGQGWFTRSISPPRQNLPGQSIQELDGEFRHFSEDLSEAWLMHDANPPLAGCAPPDSFNFYRRLNDEDLYEALHCGELRRVVTHGTELQGVTADGCYAVFHSRGKLTADANDLPAGGEPPYQLFESSCKGSTRLIGKLPGGSNCTQSSSAGFDIPAINGAGRNDLVRHSFSDDGHRLYWSCGSDLYLRFDPDLEVEGEETVTLVASNARFQAASAADGATMLFTVGNTLRRYDAVATTTTTIAEGISDAASSTGIVSLLGASDDAARAYFVSTHVLPGSGKNSEDDEAVGGGDNLYLFEAGVGGPEFTFVGTLAEIDLIQENKTPSPIHQQPIVHASRVSPDGLHAAFISAAPLTDYDNTDLNNGNALAEVFLYDATANGGTGEIVCVSCDPTGARAAGRNIAAPGAAIADAVWAAAWIPGWMSQLHPTRALSDDGQRLFFNSFEALVSRDTNGKEDVYQWERVEAQGEAGGEECIEEMGGELFAHASNGCISLISSGQDPRDSLFVDADRDGSDVFVRTGESLVPWDPGSVDVYDAREGGGLPPPPSSQPGCEGEACQSPPPAPAFQTPSSSSASGPGDPAPSPRRSCSKGKRLVVRAGKARCVRKSKKGRRSSKQRSQRRDRRAGR